MRPVLARWRAVVPVVVVMLLGLSPAHAYSTTLCSGTETWTKVGTDVFKTQGLPRSQGVTSDGEGWIFSWQGGVERTNDLYVEDAYAPWPADRILEPSYDPNTGQNHTGGTHIGDVDVYGGLVYAPYEDGGQDAGVMELNDPEYQHPYIALYDAKTLLYTGRSYALPLAYHAAGVPWVAVNGAAQEIYTAEWDMPHDRINVFNIPTTTVPMTLQRTIDLHYPAPLPAGFHLSRIQGAKVFGGSLYATRDDSAKSVFKIDLATGNVTKLFSLNPGIPAELEGMAIRPTSDGALLHLLIVVHNKVDQSLDAKDIAVEFQHFALTCS